MPPPLDSAARPGRAGSAAERRTKLLADARGVIEGRLSWLIRFEAAPADAAAKIEDVRKALAERVRTTEEARQVTDLLRDAVDAWNDRHQQTPIPAFSPIVVIRRTPHDWTSARLDRLRRWRPWGQALAARLADPGVLSPTARAGVVLASAIRYGAIGDWRMLAVLALWLADPDAWLGDAPGLPAWIDLVARSASETTEVPGPKPKVPLYARALSTISGVDEKGPYALRRWLADPDTLAAITAYFEAGPDAQARAAIAAAAESLGGLVGLIVDGLDPDRALGRPPSPRTLLEGAFTELELTAPLLDRATIAVAQGRQRSFSATPETWAAALGAAPAIPSAPQRAARRSLLMTVRSTAGAESDEDAERRATRAYSALKRLMKSAEADVRGDMTRIPVGEGRHKHRVHGEAFLRTLVAARDVDTAWWPPVARLLLDWLISLLPGRRVSTVRRYHATVAVALLPIVGCLDLRTAGGGDLTELYSDILESDPRSDRERGRLRALLRRVHRFGMDHPDWTLPEVDTEIFEGEGAATRVRALVLSERAITAARLIIRTHPDHDQDTRMAADAAFVLQRRAGLRIGEVCKPRLSDLEPWTDNPALFIADTPYGGNKTPWARRLVAPHALMKESEAQAFRAWCTRRRQFGEKGPLFGVLQPDGEVAPFDPKELGAFISAALKEATGCPEVSDHTLRHQAFGDLQRAIVEARDPEPHPLLDRDRMRRIFAGWDQAEALRAAEAVAPLAMTRDAWRGLARHAAHRTLSITNLNYLHFWCLVIFERTARRVPRATYDALIDRLAGRVRRIGAAVEPEVLELPPFEVPADPTRLLLALEDLDKGHPLATVAVIRGLDPTKLEAHVAVAKSLAAMRTRERVLRLQGPGRERCLAPQPLRSEAEKATAEALARELWQERDKLGEDLKYWIAATLLSASLNKPGVRIDRPHLLARWLRAARIVNTKRSWQVDLETLDTNAPGLDLWHEAAHGATVENVEIEGRKSIIAKVRLPRPDIEAKPNRLSKISKKYATGSPRFAAHLLAIMAGFSARDLTRITRRP